MIMQMVHAILDRKNESVDEHKEELCKENYFSKIESVD